MSWNGNEVVVTGTEKTPPSHSLILEGGIIEYIE